jgi:dihydrofolate reductase
MPNEPAGTRLKPADGPRIIGIAAVARNGVIGADGDIPWRIPEDWRRFKRLTTGQVLVMGRKTWASIGRPLPGRTTYVVTRDRMWRGEDVYAVPSLDEAFAAAAAREPATVYVAGGGEIYRAAWDRLTGLEITEVDAEPAGDVMFPAIEAGEWQETVRDAHDGFAFVTYVRR